MKIQQYQPCYLVQDMDMDVYCDLFNVLYSVTDHAEEEILLSVHLLNVWMEADFETGDAGYFEQETCDFLKDVYYKINKEIGYIIFRP